MSARKRGRNWRIFCKVRHGMSHAEAAEQEGTSRSNIHHIIQTMDREYQRIQKGLRKVWRHPPKHWGSGPIPNTELILVKKGKHRWALRQLSTGEEIESDARNRYGFPLSDQKRQAWRI